MSINIEEVKDATTWNLSLPPTSSFLQSFEWGEFQRAYGREVVRLKIFDGKIPMAFAQCIWHPLFSSRVPRPASRLGYWFCPRGPVGEEREELRIKNYELRWIEELKIKLRSIGKRILFIRIEPATSYSLPATSHPIPHVHPPYTRMLDLTRSEDDLLASMHEKTRYNIRLAEKKIVHVGVDHSPAGFKTFWDLEKETAERQKIKLHGEKYYKLMLETLNQDLPPGFWKGWSQLYVAHHGTTPLATALVIYFGDTATYVHGASSAVHREMMAPYALHWKIIRDAKDMGYKHYDFFGVNPENSRNRAYRKSWEGITRFKAGFGGEVLSYPGTFDLPISRWGYRMYAMMKRVMS